MEILLRLISKQVVNCIIYRHLEKDQIGILWGYSCKVIMPVVRLFLQIWKYPKLWVGFLKCVTQTMPQSFSVVLQVCYYCMQYVVVTQNLTDLCSVHSLSHFNANNIDESVWKVKTETILLTGFHFFDGVGTRIFSDCIDQKLSWN